MLQGGLPVNLVASSPQPDAFVVCSVLDGMQPDLHAVKINRISKHLDSTSNAIAAAATGK